MKKRQFILKFVAILALSLVLNCSVSADEFVPVEESVKVEAQAKESYLPGLPIRVTIEITNTSKQMIETLKPSVKFNTISAGLKHEGDKKYLSQTRHQSHFVLASPTFQLKPGETSRAQIDLSLLFQDALPSGRYVCEANCAVGKTTLTSHLIKSKPISIIIKDPSTTMQEDQRDLHQAMTMFLGARALLADFNKEGDSIARQIFSYLKSIDRNGEYGKVSAYYEARLEQDPQRALSAWRACLEIRDVDAPELIGTDDIWFNIGRLYYETSDLKAAKEAFLKIVEPDTATQDYLKKITKP